MTIVNDATLENMRQASKPYSTGCYACRRMRVKCDEAKPECTRCQRAKRKCPGYREESEMIFRSMNADVVSKPSSGRRKSTSPRAGTAARDSSDRDMSMTRPLATDWEENALAFFMAMHTTPAVNGRHGHMDFVEDMYCQSPSCEHLQYALKAASLAALGNATSIYGLDAKATRYYVKALQCISTAVADVKESRQDRLLTSIILIQKYELISGSRPVGKNAHDRGLMELVRLRKPDEFESEPGKSLYRIINTKLLISSLLTRPSIVAIDATTARDLFPSPWSADLASLLFRTSQVIDRLQLQLQQKTLGHEAADFAAAVQQAWSVLLELSMWANTAPPGWGSLPMPMVDAPDSDVPHMRRLHFPDGYHLGLFGCYMACRMKILQTLLDGLPYLGEEPGCAPPLLSRERLVKLLDSVVEHICGVTPYLFGDVDEEGRLRPGGMDNVTVLGAIVLGGLFRCATALKTVSQERKKWMYDQLLRIGYSFGLRHALVVREWRMAEDEQEKHMSEGGTQWASASLLTAPPLRSGMFGF